MEKYGEEEGGTTLVFDEHHTPLSNVRVCFSISVHFHHFDEHEVSLN